MGTGLALGMSLGLLIGLMTDNIALGVALGPALGMAIGAALGADDKEKSNCGRPPHPKGWGMLRAARPVFRYSEIV